MAYNFLGSLMPIWATFFLLKLHHQRFYLNDFVKHGEFALYTAAFLAPALQLVVRNIRSSKYVLGTGAVLFAVAGLVFSGIIYSGVVVGGPSSQQSAMPLQVDTVRTSTQQGGAPAHPDTVAPNPQQSSTPPYPGSTALSPEQTGVAPHSEIDEGFLFYVSISLFALSLGFAVLVTLIENQPLNTNIQKSEEEGEKHLADKFGGKKPEATVGVVDISATEEPKEPTEAELAARFEPGADAGGNAPPGGPVNG